MFKKTALFLRLGFPNATRDQDEGEGDDKANVGDDDGYPVMKVIQSRNISRNESYLEMKVIQRWKLSSDESHDSQRSDDLWRFTCGDVYPM